MEGRGPKRRFWRLYDAFLSNVILGTFLIALAFAVLFIAFAYAVLADDAIDPASIMLSFMVWSGFALLAGVVLLTSRQDSNDRRQASDHPSSVRSPAVDKKAEQPVSEASVHPLAEDAPSIPDDPPAPVGQDEALKEDDASSERSDAIEIERPPAALVEEEGRHEVPADSIEDVRSLLIPMWRDYLKNGDGHFNVRGLRERLVQHGIEADALEGAEIEAGGNALIVDPNAEDRCFYVLPSFAKPPSAIRDWYEDTSEGGLMARVGNVRKLAVGRWTDEGFEVVERGTVS